MHPIRTEYWAKPIPIRQFDWIATYADDEPNDAGTMLHGHGRTEAEAVVDLIENHPRGGVWCHERDRRCDTCMHSRQHWTRDHDGADYCRTVCNVRGVGVEPDSVCICHEFEGERGQPRTVFIPRAAEPEIQF